MYKINLPQLEVMRLITAGLGVVEKVHNGDLFAGNVNAMERSVAALDDLESALESTVKTLPNSISPFLRYRSETMANNTGGEMLRQLITHLGSETGGLINLHKLLVCLSANKTNIALDMMEHFANHGTNDPHFVEIYSRVLNFTITEAGAEHF